MKRLAVAMALVGIGLTAQAAVQIENIRYEDTIVMEQRQLVLNGAGLRKKVFFKVYSAGLYLGKKASSVDAVMSQSAPVRVQLGLLRNVSASSFVDALKDGLMDNSTSAQQKEIASELNALIDVMNKIGDVKIGDMINFDFSATKGTCVSLNGRMIGEGIGGKALYDAVLRIWLGPKAIDDTLKRALIP
jgi:hypothetical protein